MNLIDVMRNRRSVREYTQEAIPEEQIEQVLKAGMLSASGRAICPWEFIVVREKEMLEKMSGCRAGNVRMLSEADCAIVVIADGSKTDVWIEDCSCVMSNMHLMADSLGIGSCWIQGRLREASDGRSAEEYLRDLLDYPEHYKLQAVLSMGMPESKPKPHDLTALPMDKVHRERF